MFPLLFFAYFLFIAVFLLRGAIQMTCIGLSCHKSQQGLTEKHPFLVKLKSLLSIVISRGFQRASQDISVLPLI